MLIRSHDAAFDDEEWRVFLREHDFGQLVAAGAGRAAPIITPVHFVYDGEATILLHLARANPVLAALAENPVAVMAVIGAYTYIPTDWNANPGEPVEYGVPTSYYAAVQATGVCEIIDDPEALAAILRTQLAHFQPAGGHAPVTAGDTPYGRQLPAIRGVRLSITDVATDVRAKFKFGGNKTLAHQRAIAEHLQQRGAPFDSEARRHQLRRLEHKASSQAARR
ncbi:MAG TPA: FMN-binding negative transcriptional regulator [Ktedonobacterales bacterium]